MSNNEISPTVRAAMAITAEELPVALTETEAKYRERAWDAEYEWKQVDQECTRLASLRDTLMGCIEDNHEQIGSLTAECDEWKARAERAEAALAEKDADIRRLTATLRSTREDLGRCETYNATILAENKYLKNQETRTASFVHLMAQAKEEIGRCGECHSCTGQHQCKAYQAYHGYAEIARLQAEAAVLREMLEMFSRVDPDAHITERIEEAKAVQVLLSTSDAGKAMLERMERHERDRLYAIPALEEIARQFGKCKCHEEQCAGCIALELRDRFAALDGKEGV